MILIGRTSAVYQRLRDFPSAISRANDQAACDVRSSRGFLEKVMRNAPRVSAFVREQFCTSHIEDLPSLEPNSCIFLPIRCLQMRPNRLLVITHLPEPILQTGLALLIEAATCTDLACLGIMFPTDPPLLCQREISLEVVQQVGAGHGASRKEMRAHPSLFKIVRCRLVAEDMHEELSSWLQRPCYLTHEELIVLHMLEHLDGNNPIERIWFELVVHDVTCDCIEIAETLGRGLPIDILLLKPGVGEGRNLGMWKRLGEVESTRAPSAAENQMSKVNRSR